MVIESIAAENLLSIVVSLSMLCGILLGILLTLLFVWAYKDSINKRNKRARMMCFDCRRKYLDSFEY